MSQKKGIQPVDYPNGSSMSYWCQYKGFWTPNGSRKGPMK